MPLVRIETEPRRAPSRKDQPKAESNADELDDSVSMGSLPAIPPWGLRDPAAARATPTPWSLEVIKSGSVVGSVAIPAAERGRYIFGRAKERVHVHLEHPSISRIHGPCVTGLSVFLYSCVM